MDKDILNTWNQTEERLVNFIHQKVQNLEVAKDLKQEVFLKVFTKLNTLREKNKIIPWIWQITRNEINSHFRKAKQSDLEEVGADFEVLEENLTQTFATCIIPMIASLPEKYREAITLTEIEGYSQKELAQMLNISYSGAKSRVQRGREMLKSVLEQCCTISTDQYGNVMGYEKRNCERPCD